MIIDGSRHYRILTTDTPSFVHKGNAWGVTHWFTFWLMYYIITGFSQHTSHDSSVRTVHGVSFVSSNSDQYITSIQDLHNSHTMVYTQRQYMRRPLWVQILINIYHYRILTINTPRLAHKDNSWGATYEFNVLHHYRLFSRTSALGYFLW